MVEKKLAAKADNRPKIMPVVYFVSNLKIRYIPKIMNKPTRISPLEIFCFFINGSKMAMKSVTDDKQIRLTETLATLIEWKKNIQCRATMLPVKKN